MERCEHCAEVGDIRKKIRDIHEILTGNGKPESGLVFKVAIVTNHVNFMNRFGWLILTGAVGVPFTVLTIYLTAKLGH